jgi:hypothetical protein
LRDRFYDSQTGRFLRQDTYQGRQSEPLTLHKYSYTHNNPVNGVDPSGFMTLTGLLGGLAILGTFAAASYTGYTIATASGLHTGGSGISDDEAWRIERNILAFSHAQVPAGADRRSPADGGGRPLCDAFTFASLMQYAAGQISPTRWVNSRSTRIDFLKIAADMFTGDMHDQFYKGGNPYRYLGKLGDKGPRGQRPSWLKTHDDDALYWKRVSGAGDARDKEEEPGTYRYANRFGSGRRDHLIHNAFAGDGAGKLVDSIRGEKSQNDQFYNQLGRNFGSALITHGSIAQFSIWGWLYTHTAP